MRAAFLWLLLIGTFPAFAGDPSIVEEWTVGCQTQNPQNFRILRPGGSCHKRLLRDGKVVLDSEIHIDNLGRRVVSQPKHGDDSSFVAFLGDSFTFGEGVSDAEALPAQFAKLNPGVAVYNYGNSGYGPNNLLQLWQTRDYRKEIPQQRGKFVYLWIADDARRVFGSVSRPFTDRFPRYVFDSHGGLELLGSLRGTQPIRYWIFDWIRRWKLNERLHFDYPPRVTGGDYRLITRIVSELEKKTSEQFPESEFYLVLFPEGDDLQRYARDRFVEAFAGTRVHVVDWVEAQVMADSSDAALPDSHPSAHLYQDLARYFCGHLLSCSAH